VRALLTAVTCEKGDLDANLAMHLEMLATGARAGCEVVVFPEFSLTGSVDPTRRPDHAVAIDHRIVRALVAATLEHGVAAVFGIAERAGDAFFISQVVAAGGVIAGVQRKRHLGDDEIGYSVGVDALACKVGDRCLGIVICAEANVDWTWDATAHAGADVVLFCSAPGLYGRRTDEESWRAGFEWWRGRGVGDAIRHATCLGVPVAMATQVGATVDEDFPGIAALVAADGTVVERLPDWRPGTLVVDIPKRAR